MSNYEAEADQLPMPTRSDHKVCVCGTEYFEKKCPNCAERDRLAEAQVTRDYPLITEQYVSIPGGTLTYAGPFGSPDWVHSVEGSYKVRRLYEEGGLIWACLDLGGKEETWVKVGPKFGVMMYKKHTRPKTSH